MLSCMSCFRNLHINPLLVIWFTNIFSHSAGCLFALLIVSFAVRKLLSLIRSHLFIFVMTGQKNIAVIYVKECSITVLSLTYFEGFFLHDVKKCFHFILVHIAVQFSQHHLLKRLPFLHWIFCLLCHRLIDRISGFISEISILFHWSIFLFLCQWQLFWLL